MNHTAKNLIRIAGVVAGLGAAVWAMRDRLLPAPEVPEGPPPRFREAPPRDASPADPEDLTVIKGIGPVTARKLADAGIVTFRGLSSADASTVVSAAGTNEAAAKAWIDAAKSLT
ncbi:MAG TPA: helix-hairpin-helix domain-containing protein [Acidimicrobiia bacterium]|nr:helix-hairpin-helix domain-containing protein [Acidimicrobiia bacterium]